MRARDVFPILSVLSISPRPFSQMQALLDANIQGKRRKLRAAKESLMTDILFDGAGVLRIAEREYKPSQEFVLASSYHHRGEQGVYR